MREPNFSVVVLFDCLISEDEEEDFSKGAEDFVEAAKKRRTERQSDNGNIHLFRKALWNCWIVKNKLFDLVSESSLGIESLIIGAATFERSYRLDHDTHVHLVQL